jgi:hypothetical protein
MLASMPVLPAIVKTLKNQSIRILTQQFERNFLITVFKKKQEVFYPNGIIPPQSVGVKFFGPNPVSDSGAPYPAQSRGLGNS